MCFGWVVTVEFLQNYWTVFVVLVGTLEFVVVVVQNYGTVFVEFVLVVTVDFVLVVVQNYGTVFVVLVVVVALGDVLTLLVVLSRQVYLVSTSTCMCQTLSSFSPSGLVTALWAAVVILILMSS